MVVGKPQLAVQYTYGMVPWQPHTPYPYLPHHTHRGWRWSGSPIPVNPCQSVGWPVARRNSTNAQHSPHFDPLISHCEKYSKSLMVSGKSQKETARHTSTLPYKEEEIFGEFHTSFAFLFHSFHFKWQATLVVLCHVRLQHQFDSYFVSFLCVYICILWGPLRILSWACCVYSPSLLQGPNIWAVEWIIH